MRKYIIATVLMLALLGLKVATAQSTTVTVFANNVTDNNGNRINGTITFQPALQSGKPSSYQKPGGGVAVIKPTTVPITNGAFSVILPDTTRTNPQNICFAVGGVEQFTKVPLFGDGYTCVQPHYTSQQTGDWCNIGQCDFDNYIPSLDPVLQVEVGPTGSTGATGPNCSVSSPPGECDLTVVKTTTLNGVTYPATFADFQNAVGACLSNPCAVGISSTVAVTSTYSVPSNVTLQFNNGAQLQPATGTTLTINGPIQAPALQIFGGAGHVVLGTATTRAPFEWFGARGDSNGGAGSGVINTTTMQACLTALTTGQCVMQGAKYRTTSALVINKSNVGIAGVAADIRNDTIFPTPSSSVIVIDSATSDGLQVAGASNGSQVTGNRFSNFAINRTLAPGTGAAGMRVQYSSDIQVDHVTGMDHTACFYLHDVGSLGYGYFDNSACGWGYNGFLETSGSLAGFEVDSLDGLPSPSLRIRNSFVASATPQNAAVTTYGLQSIGLAINDLHVTHLETAQTSYGVFLHATGGSFGQSSDIFINDAVNDGCLISCVYLQGIRGTVLLNGGWDYENANAANSYVIDLEDSTNVTVFGQKLYYPATGKMGIFANSSGSLHIVDNWILGNGAAISLNTTSGSIVSRNIMNGPNAWGTNIIELKSNSQGNVVSENSLQGTATNGIFLDPTSVSVAGLETNQIGSLPTLGTITNLVNDASLVGASTPESLIVGNPSIPGSGLLQFGRSVTVATLPTVGGHGKTMMVVTDSTTITTEGQACVGGGSVTALAFNNGVSWKCF